MESIFYSLKEAQVVMQWRVQYNTVRPLLGARL